ncbi:helix-turn-helix domain-containing protein [Streptomyces chartreusis]|uniref:hypothetical protein n=1 Tax=Streptomyces chartreusis TaxID=1969 RepID=UPI0036D185A1
MSSDENNSRRLTSEGAAYAVELRRIVDEYLAAGGGSQKVLAGLLHVSEPTLSRYLSGERVAPLEKVTALQHVLMSVGLALDESEAARLMRLAARAHEASGAPSVKLRYLEGEFGRLKQMHMAALIDLNTAREQLVSVKAGRDEALLRFGNADIELQELGDRIRGLGRALETAREDARAAEMGREQRAALLEENEARLTSLQSYSQSLEVELERQKGEAHQLRADVARLKSEARTDEVVTRWAFYRAFTVPTTQRALDAGYRGDYAEAVAILGSVIEDWDPDHSEAFSLRYNLAMWRGRSGDPAGAVSEFERLLSIWSPESLGGYYGMVRHDMAVWKAEAGDVASAVAELIELLAEREKADGPHAHNTSLTRREVNRWKAALQA